MIIMLVYLKILLLFVWLPTFLLWMLYFDILRRYKQTILLCAFFALIFSIPWDYLAVKLSIWSFPKETNLGISFLNLPFEEYLFYIFATIEVCTITLVLKHRAKGLIRSYKT